MIDVQPLRAEAAAKVLQGMHTMDPRGMTEPGEMLDLAKRGACLRIVKWTGDKVQGSAVIVMTKKNGVAWVNAAKGTGSGMTPVISAVSKVWARKHGCHTIACQTKRRGLQKRLHGLGWSTSGFILMDTIQ